VALVQVVEALHCGAVVAKDLLFLLVPLPVLMELHMEVAVVAELTQLVALALRASLPLNIKE
jgi:hypothetical protein